MLLTQYILFLCHGPIAAWEIWPPEETSPGWEKETGGKEKVPGWRAQHIQTEKDCCRALAESSSTGRGLYHTQEGQREKKVSIVVPLHFYCCSTGAGTSYIITHIHSWCWPFAKLVSGNSPENGLNDFMFRFTSLHGQEVILYFRLCSLPAKFVAVLWWNWKLVDLGVLFCPTNITEHLVVSLVTTH